MADQLPSAGPVGDLPDAWIDAAAAALDGEYVTGFRHKIEIALAAALPLIRAHFADQITGEAVAVNTRYEGTTEAAHGYVDGLLLAARLARGGDTDG